MRVFFLILIVAVAALILAVMTGMIDLRQTQPRWRPESRPRTAGS